LALAVFAASAAPAIAFFASLVSEGALQKLIDDKMKESLYVGVFKGKKDPRDGVLAESDSWQFSRALSGFANSDGGVLLWGVKTNRHEEASSLKPISQVQEVAVE